MQDEKREHWIQLCADAANEQDTKKLMVLVDEINRLLEAKEDRLNKLTPLPNRCEAVC